MTPRYVLVSVLVILATLGACASSGVDRTDAVARVVDEAGGRVTEEQAGCYVDRVLDEIGPSPLRPGASIPPEQIARLTTIRVDCIGVTNLGADTPNPVATAPYEGGLPGPKRRGDAPALDALWDRCEQGFGQACDDLFDQAPMASEYEDFGVTCGRRTREEQCAAVYPSPGVTLPSPAQPTTSVPPLSP